MYIIGVIIILVALAILISSIALGLFNQNIIKNLKELFNNVDIKKEVVRQSDLYGLPTIVQKWMYQSGVIGKEKAITVQLKQKAYMRLGSDKPWMPVEAEQFFRVDEPGFIWKAKVKMAPLLYIFGKDMYHKGKGQMLIKILALIKIVNSTGKEIDQGSILRYLAEIIWFPTGALSKYIEWDEIDEHSARAIMSYRGITASGVFTFNDNGEPIKFAAKRFREMGGKYELTDWGGYSKEFKKMGDLRIPTQGEVIWKLPTGDFDWFHWEITEIEYNKPIPR
jgi:hypothetical protein